MIVEDLKARTENNYPSFVPDLICPLCGIRQALQNEKKTRNTKREHTPPKCIFTSILAENFENLITVPACEECNHGTRDADALFKVDLGIYLGSFSPLWYSTRDSLNKNHKERNKILDNTSDSLEPYGQNNLGYRTSRSKKPFNTVIKKTIRGLHWHVTNEVLPHDAVLTINLIEQGKPILQDLKNIFDKYGQWIKRGNGAFEAQYAIATDCKFSSMWFLRFYDQDFCTVYVEHHVTTS